MTNEEIWNCEISVTELLGCDIPDWIEQDISPYDVIAVVQGGCASGAYMPAVTYSRAIATMGEYGDEVLDYIEQNYGELPAPKQGESWSGMACYYLSMAVEIWAGSTLSELEYFERWDD